MIATSFLKTFGKCTVSSTAKTHGRIPFPPQLINGHSRITLAQHGRLPFLPETLRRIQSKGLLLYHEKLQNSKTYNEIDMTTRKYQLKIHPSISISLTSAMEGDAEIRLHNNQENGGLFNMKNVPRHTEHQNVYNEIFINKFFLLSYHF